MKLTLKNLARYLEPVERQGLSGYAIRVLIRRLNRSELMSLTDYSLCTERLRGWGLGVQTVVGTGPKLKVKWKKRG